jgi:hypothetical protein
LALAKACSEASTSRRAAISAWDSSFDDDIPVPAVRKADTALLWSEKADATSAESMESSGSPALTASPSRL